MSFDGKYYIGRTMQDVPEMDGIVYIKNKINKKPEEVVNHFINCKVTEVSDYDVIAEMI